jgi:hypothetical protein
MVEGYGRRDRDKSKKKLETKVKKIKSNGRNGKLERLKDIKNIKGEVMGLFEELSRYYNPCRDG